MSVWGENTPAKRKSGTFSDEVGTTPRRRRYRQWLGWEATTAFSTASASALDSSCMAYHAPAHRHDGGGEKDEAYACASGSPRLARVTVPQPCQPMVNIRSEGGEIEKARVRNPGLSELSAVKSYSRRRSISSTWKHSIWSPSRMS